MKKNWDRFQKLKLSYNAKEDIIEIIDKDKNLTFITKGLTRFRNAWDSFYINRNDYNDGDKLVFEFDNIYSDIPQAGDLVIRCTHSNWEISVEPHGSIVNAKIIPMSDNLDQLDSWVQNIK